MRISPYELRERISKLLTNKGLDRFSADATALCMVNADLLGVTTHGTVVLPSHIKKIEQGGYNLKPEFPIINQTAAMAIVDAENSIGFASGTYCMQLAMKHCREQGIYSVFSRHGNAYGAASCYSLLAAEEGLIGITFCNAPPAMAPIGSKEKLLGTNPLSVAFPSDDNQPIIIDMATSKVAKSKFLQAKRDGKQIPAGWALDVDGNPTTDPDTAIQGLVCPMEGFKGYGLALIIDIISGMLSGAAYQNGVGKFYNTEGTAMNVGHTFIAIDPKVFMGDAYNQQIIDYKNRIRTSNPVQDNIPIAIPGDDKLLHREECFKAGGISVSEEILALLDY